MDTLFPLETTSPQGFQYFPGFINQQEEYDLVEEISALELKTFVFQGYEARRKTASFGYDWSFDHRTLSKGNNIPARFDGLIENVARFLALKPESFAEILFTEYPANAVINWHRDAPPFELIAGISLMSDCTFRFRPHDAEKQSRKSIISLPVKRRSLYVIAGAARTDWQHSILPVKEKRFSITLRTLKANSVS